MPLGVPKAEGNAATNNEIREEMEKMKKTMKIAAMVAALAMVLSGVAFSAETIKVGHLADLTGPTGDVGKPYAEGVQAYKNYINAQGGINGKQIEMQMFDYAYDKNKAVNQYKKYKEDKVVAIEGWGTGDTEALTGFVTADKIPYISASYSAHLTDAKKTPYNFFCAADYTTALRAGLLYLKEGWKEKRAPKIVFIYPNHPYGIAPIKGGKEYAKELGFEVLGDEDVGLKAIEANSQLLSVKNKGADFAWIGGTTNSTAVILKDAKKLGLKTKFFSNIWGIDETTPKLAEGAEEGALVMVGSARVRGQGPRDDASHVGREDAAGDALHPRVGLDDGPRRGAEAGRQEGSDHRRVREGRPRDLEGFRHRRADPGQDHLHVDRPPAVHVGEHHGDAEGEARLQEDHGPSAQGGVARAVGT